jgi:hypothetical protein
MQVQSFFNRTVSYNNTGAKTSQISLTRRGGLSRLLGRSFNDLKGAERLNGLNVFNGSTLAVAGKSL